MKKLTTLPGSCITACYIVPGLPHVLLAAERSAGWQSLNRNFASVREEIEKSDAEVILYFSTQWLSVLGYLFQADPEPEWTLVDHNWHEMGSIHYKFKIDTELAKLYHDEVKALGHYAREVNYRGFPIDTGTIVAQKLLNPQNRFKAVMASCNMYAEKQETLAIGQAAIRALQRSGKKAVVVVVSGLSSRFATTDIDPGKDQISSLKDDEWNRKILEIFSEGRLEDVSEVAREYAKQANADMGFKSIWWLNGLCGKSNEFTGRVFDYQAVWGTGAGLIGLYPKFAIQPLPEAEQAAFSNEADLVERLSVSTSRATGSTPALRKQGSTQPTRSVPTAATVKEVSKSSLKISTDKAPPPVGPYPHARREGEFLFLSGCGPRRPGTKSIPGVTLDANGQIVDYDIVVQTHSVFANIKVILEASGATLADVVDVQVYLTNMQADFAIFNRVYGEYFGTATDAEGNHLGPCRTTIEVGALPTPIGVELKVVARLAGG